MGVLKMGDPQWRFVSGVTSCLRKSCLTDDDLVPRELGWIANEFNLVALIYPLVMSK